MLLTRSLAGVARIAVTGNSRVPAVVVTMEVVVNVPPAMLRWPIVVVTDPALAQVIVRFNVPAFSAFGIWLIGCRPLEEQRPPMVLSGLEADHVGTRHAITNVSPHPSRGMGARIAVVYSPRVRWNLPMPRHETAQTLVNGSHGLRFYCNFAFARATGR
jgi:hypothetical protein